MLRNILGCEPVAIYHNIYIYIVLIAKLRDFDKSLSF